MVITLTATISARNLYGDWTLAFSLFSYYWTHQVFTNIMAVATAGTVGSWFVFRKETPVFTEELEVSDVSVFTVLLHAVFGLVGF